jgi:acetyltransferase
MRTDSVKPTNPADPAPRAARRPLDPLFAPRTVAVIGASEKPGSVGRTILTNLVGSPFGGTVVPVNPHRASVLGIRACAAVADIPEPVDLAVVCTPAAAVPEIVGQCAEAGVAAAIVISAGFRETGSEGLALERETLARARAGGLRLVGPNCLGVMSPVTGLNATFAGSMARPGSVGFISQSGALCAAVLDWSHEMNVGFSHFVSIGSMIDVGWGDLIDHLGDDPRTKSIVLYMESIGDARAFLSAAREVALTKPIIVIKAGRTAAAARAAASHTGTLTGSDEVLDAAFRRSGVLRVGSIAELFYMAEVLGTQPRPRGRRLSIVTNAGAPGVLATDALIANGGELTVLSDQSVAALNRLLPAHWSHANPIDVLDDADPERYAKALEIAAADPNSDGLLVILTPQAMTDPTQTAELLRQRAARFEKPLLASWMGGVDVAAGERILNTSGIPTFPYPDTAARMFFLMWKYSYNLRGLYETPALPADIEDSARRRAAADAVIERVRRSGRIRLSEAESRDVLAAYDIPVVETRVARTADEAASTAADLGYPVVVKLYSDTITHKTDVGGVELNLQDERDVREAFERIRASVGAKAGPGHFQGVTVQPMMKADGGYELIVGSVTDPQFGPVVLFGSGGQLVEVYRDRALALAPLNTTLARRMMEQTRILEALKGVRGRKPVDLPALESLLVRFSRMIVEQRWIREVDINPLLASDERLVALDARIFVHGLDVGAEALPPLPIRPYPTQYVGEWRLKDGTPVTIRPIRPEDEPLMVRFHEMLSERSVYFRYFHLLKLNQRVAHERLTRICFIDYDREIALVAERSDPTTGERAILGVGRLTKLRGANEAEFAVVVRDEVQGKGLGCEFLSRLRDVARDEGLERLTADVLAENTEMVRLCERLGFETSVRDDDPQVMRVTLALGGAQ